MSERFWEYCFDPVAARQKGKSYTNHNPGNPITGFYSFIIKTSRNMSKLHSQGFFIVQFITDSGPTLRG